MARLVVRLALLLSLFLYPLLLMNPAFASSVNLTTGANATLNESFLINAYQNTLCKTNFTVSYISNITSVVPALSSLSTYSTTIKSESAFLQTLATEGNISSYRSYIAGTYDPELRNISANVMLQIKTANLSNTILTTLKNHYNISLSTFRSCSINSAKGYAIAELNIYNTSIRRYSRQITSLNNQGYNTTSLSQLLSNAQSQIIAPLATGVSQSNNSSQIIKLLAEYCLFDGCKNGTNFHLAAHFSLDLVNIKFEKIQSTKNLTNSSLAQIQSHITNASSILTTVGTNVYVDSQGKNIFYNLSTAARLMEFDQLQYYADLHISVCNNAINSDNNQILKFKGRGENVSGLNLTLLRAHNQIIIPLENAVRNSTNASQLYSALNRYCLEDSCPNGTNFHLSSILRLDQINASLAYVESRSSSSSNSMINQTALANEKNYISSVISIINSTGSGQYSQNQITNLNNLYKNFTSHLKTVVIIVRSSRNRTGGIPGITGIVGSNVVLNESSTANILGRIRNRTTSVINEIKNSSVYNSLKNGSVSVSTSSSSSVSSSNGTATSNSESSASIGASTGNK